MKTCSICSQEKDFSEYHKDKSAKDGLVSRCKSCEKNRRKAYYDQNADRLREYSNDYYRVNKEKVRESAKAAHEKDPEKRKSERKARYWKDPESAKKAAKEWSYRKIEEDPVFKMAVRCRKRCWEAFTRSGYTKRSKTFDLIGCSQEELSRILESMFKPGMTWDNYGKWHIDHIVPLSSANTIEEVEALCHYSNLQPLWAEENLRKGAKIDYSQD